MTWKEFGQKNIYAVVTPDKFELPLIVGTIEEICKYAGVSKMTVISSISRSTNHGYRSKYVKVGRIIDIYEEDEWSDEE